LRLYLDTSVILASLLEGNDRLTQIPADTDLASSRLLWVETRRVLERCLRTGVLSPHQVVQARQAFEETAQGIIQLRISEAVLRRAEESFPLPIRTLDAIHLSTALAWAADANLSDFELWTFDQQFNQCAAAMGIRTPWLEK
jgi:predicted nucleic acid-binding protein